MSDAFNVTAAYDKPSYNAGDVMTVTISGGDVQTTINTGQTGALTLTITAADGATTTIALPATVVKTTITTPQSVKITSIADTSNRVWTIATSGLTATAIA